MKSIFSDFLKEFMSLKKQILIISLAIIASYSVYVWASEDFIIKIGLENNLFELATVAFFLTASFFCLRSFFKTKSVFLLLLAIIFFVGAGEELSWGQQLLHFSTPDTIKKDNIQGEFNIHNLDVFNTGDELHQKKTGWKRLLEINFMFRVFCIAFGILLPLSVYFISPMKKLANQIKLPVPPLAIGIFFMVNWLAFRTTLDSLPQGKPDEPNATYLIVHHPSNDTLTNQKTDTLIRQQIQSILFDSAKNENSGLVKRFEVIRKGPNQTDFEVKFIPLDERKSGKTSDYYKKLAQIPVTFSNLKIEVNKDNDYYCTTTEGFECLSALIFMLISIYFFKKRATLFV